MSEKIGSGIGVSFPTNLSETIETGISDGYYYQFDIPDPRTATGWIGGPLLHDGNTSTGYQSLIGTAQRSMSIMISRDSGMTFDNFLLTPGFTQSIWISAAYGSNDLQSWTLLSFDGDSSIPVGSGSFTYYPNSIGISSSSLLGPYKHFVVQISDSGSPCQVGCADVRIKNGGVEVGP